MYTGIEKREIAKRLQAKINTMQGLGKSAMVTDSDFSPFSFAFPDQIFPKGAIHEFISYEPADAAATSGFITALTGKFMKEGGLCLWIGSSAVFAPGLKHFGIEPDCIVFIRSAKLKDTLWIIEEALKCEALTAVIAEIAELGFTESRRFQLAVERSGVTAFIHRFRPRIENATACTARWKITTLPGFLEHGLPGVGHSNWKVELLKVRNGRPAFWQVAWIGQHFLQVSETEISIASIQERQTG